VKELRASMIEAYDADPEIIEQDLVRFLEEMLSIGAIKRK
jgi:hypothetical protein